jgi:hypothetical protein
MPLSRAASDDDHADDDHADGVPFLAIAVRVSDYLQGGLAWQSPVLPRGERVCVLTVLAESNPDSRYVWVNVDKFEVEA